MIEPAWKTHDGSSAPPKGVNYDDFVEVDFGDGNSIKLRMLAEAVVWRRVVKYRHHRVATLEGRKDDKEKLRFELLPGDALRAIVTIFTFGAKKYSDRNWEAGMDWSRAFGALQRHLWAWWHREGPDEETGHSHLWHAGCCILFLIAWEMRSKGNDNRP